MKEGRLDRYFARKDTLLAKGLRRISPKTGEKYRQSKTKRILDIGLALSFMAIYAPVAKVAKWRVTHEDGLDPIYRQMRVLRPSDEDSEGYTLFEIRKIRSMHPGSDSKELFGASKYHEENDPRLLHVGPFVRSRRLDEYPQLKQVVKGEMSFTGIRPIHPFDWETMHDTVGDEKFLEWKSAYGKDNPAYGSLYKVMETQLDYPHKLYWDLKYAKEANLGMDLYIAYMALRMNFSKQSK